MVSLDLFEDTLLILQLRDCNEPKHAESQCRLGCSV
jgi:hypothetical protein